MCKHLYKYLIITLLSVVTAVPLCGQTTPREEIIITSGEQLESQVNIDTLAISLLDYLPPLQVLIDSAMMHSPEIAHYESVIKAREHDVARERKAWAEDVYFGYQYNYGTQGTDVINQGTGSIVTNEINSGYQYSVAMRLPLSLFYGRQNKIGIIEAQLESDQYKRDETVLSIKEKVIQEYNELLLLQRLVKIQSRAKESAILIMEMAEQRFRDGELSLDQLGANSDLRNKHESEYERLRSEFSNSYYRLERLVGVSFSKFEKY
jgi:outer membrane protein TolC